MANFNKLFLNQKLWSNKVIFSAKWGLSLFLFKVINSPAFENKRSDGTEVGEIENVFFAIQDKIGKWVECNLKNSSGFEFSWTGIFIFE